MLWEKLLGNFFLVYYCYLIIVLDMEFCITSMALTKLDTKVIFKKRFEETLFQYSMI